MNWTLIHRPVDNADTNGLYALVNTTGGNAYGVTLRADEIASQEVFGMSAEGFVLTNDLIAAEDEIGHSIDLGRGYPEGGHITVEWQTTPGGQIQSQTIELHQHQD
jgi:hypothetical protein